MIFYPIVFRNIRWSARPLLDAPRFPPHKTRFLCAPDSPQIFLEFPFCPAFLGQPPFGLFVIVSPGSMRTISGLFMAQGSIFSQISSTAA